MFRHPLAAPPRPILLLLVLALVGLPADLSSQAGGRQQVVRPPHFTVEPLDRQVVLDQDDMTWDHYRPIPGIAWTDPRHIPSERTIRIAMLLADFDDHDFVMTMPKHSDPFGNPQVAPVTRDQIPQFYADFWNKPQAVNHFRSVHEYWMELSHGRIGVEMVPYGPYRMPGSYTQISNATLDSIWRADQGPEVHEGYDLIMRIYAGYDETTVWQEFGEMKFQTRDDITRDFCNPDPSQPCWMNTRYTDWTSWLAGSYLWSNSAITMGESSGSIRHEISHAAFRIGDNNNNPYVEPYRRVGSGPWDVMDRGSFNGPGGPHSRYLIPVTYGGSAPAGLLLRQRMYFGFTESGQVLILSRDGLVRSGPAVSRVTARAVKPLPGEMTGIVVRLDGDLPHDRTPWEDPVTNPLSQGVQDYNDYTVEVVQRIGYDSFSPTHGVLITKNKDQASPVGGPNSFNLFNWVIDANPQDIQVVDFYRPNGEAVMRTVADYRQLNDATFHAGLNSGSEYEWVDRHNRLHFYVLDLHHSPEGILSYTLGVRSLDGSGPQVRGVAAAPAEEQDVLREGRVQFTVGNTGAPTNPPADAHPEAPAAHFGTDIYRLSVFVDGAGWAAQLKNAILAVPFGESRHVPVFVEHAENAADTAVITLRVASESDPSMAATASYTVER